MGKPCFEDSDELPSLAEMPAHLEPYAERARKHLPWARLFAPNQLPTAIAEQLAEIHREKLEIARRQANLLRREGSIDDAELDRLVGPILQEIVSMTQDVARDRERAGTR